MSRRICVRIGELTVRGASKLDAQRLQDAIQRELEILAPELAATAMRSRIRPHVAGGSIAVPRRIELAASTLCDVIRKAVLP